MTGHVPLAMCRFKWLVPATLEPVLYANDCLHTLQQALLQPAPTFSIVKCSQTIDFFFLRLLGWVSGLVCCELGSSVLRGSVLTSSMPTACALASSVPTECELTSSIPTGCK
uniref:Uncharacterized protein n=1 Tax=Opuntia streptacantha TaxID=393608 RepID=A0A7C9DFU6_OPUST